MVLNLNHIGEAFEKPAVQAAQQANNQNLRVWDPGSSSVETSSVI